MPKNGNNRHESIRTCLFFPNGNDALPTPGGSLTHGAKADKDALRKA